MGLLKVARLQQTLDRLTHQATGSPILVHTETGSAADELLDLLEEAGVPPERVVLNHVDRNPDPRVHIRLAERGAFLQYDTPGRTKYQPENTTIELMRRLFDAGYGKNLLLGGTGRGDRTGKRTAAGRAWIICLPRLPDGCSRKASQKRK